MRNTRWPSTRSADVSLTTERERFGPGAFTITASTLSKRAVEALRGGYPVRVIINGEEYEVRL